MIKKFATQHLGLRTAVITAAALFCLVPAGSFAIEKGEVLPAVEPAMETVTENVTPDGNLPDSDELLEGYLMQQVDLQVQNEKPKKTRPVRLDAEETKIYNFLKEQIQGVAEGTTEMAAFEILYGDIYSEELLSQKYSAGNLGVESLFLTDEDGEYILEDGMLQITDDAAEAIGEKYRSPDIDALLNNLLADEPYSLFWFDKTVGISAAYMINFRVTETDGEPYLSVDPSESSWQFYFAVSEDYCPNEYYYWNFGSESKPNEAPISVDTKLIQSIGYAAENAQSIVRTNKRYSDYNKLKNYKDEICNMVDYDDDTEGTESTPPKPYGNPWQLISVFDNDPGTNVVCEGYSKAFKFLCDMSSFENDDLIAYLMTGKLVGGTGEGDHMWNLVHTGDENYLVDVTNCDKGTIGYSDKLFMVGCPNGATDDNETYDYKSIKYTFHIGTDGPTGISETASSNPVSYTYDSDTLSLYDPADLSIASSNCIDLGGEDQPPTDITGGTVANIVTKTYSGSAQTQDPTITVAGETLIKGEDYTIAYANNVNAGKATMTITGKGNYTGTLTREFTINRKAITPSVALSTSTYTYNGTVKTPAATVKSGTKTLKNGTDYTLAYASGRKNAGKYSVKVTLKGNYSGSATKYFTINKAANPAKVTPRTVTLWQSVLKKRSSVVGRATAITISKSQGKLTYQLTSVSAAKFKKYFRVNASSGSITALKGLKKGNYTVRVRVTAAGNANYKPVTKYVNVIIRVK